MNRNMYLVVQAAEEPEVAQQADETTAAECQESPQNRWLMEACDSDGKLNRCWLEHSIMVGM